MKKFQIGDTVMGIYSHKYHTLINQWQVDLYNDMHDMHVLIPKENLIPRRPYSDILDFEGYNPSPNPF